jgi:septal ring factor EnvC (AmiA/AmiB activator)
MTAPRQQRRPLLLALLALLTLCGSAAAGEREEKEAELAQLRQRIAALTRELESVRGRYDSLRSELRQTERRIGTLSRTLKELDADLGRQQKKQAELHKRADGLQRSIADQRHYLAGQVRASYAMGRQEYMKILLNQENPSTVGRLITYYDYLNKARSERIAALETTIRELEQVRAELEAQTERLRKLREQRAREKGQLEATRGERRKLVQQLKSEISDKDRHLSGMVRDEQELKALIGALSRALSDIPAEPGNRKPFSSLKGKLKWPAKGPLVNRFGSQRKLGKLTWQGVMIGAGGGQEVRAVSHGRVAFADWLRGYGLLVIIDHGDGYMSLYGHNQSLYKETGDWVEPGEVIATVGDSGGQESSGLYFEIRKDGRPTDPVRWCRR